MKNTKTQITTKRYSEYRDSGVDWIGDIPVGWEIRKISHVYSKIGSGTTPLSGSATFYKNGTINWLQTGDLNDGVIQTTTKQITQKALLHYSVLKKYPAGSLVIAMYGATIGKLGILDIVSTTNQACCVLQKSTRVRTRYMFFVLSGFKSKIISMSYGGGQPNISQDLIKSLRLPFPSLPEQKTIAEFLDAKCEKIDWAVAQKERMIKLLKERKQIVIQSAVTRGLNPDAKMKDSGVDWIGEIPAHWEVRKAKYLFFEANERSTDGSEELLSVSHMTGVTPRSERDVNMFLASDYTGSKLCKKGDIVYNIMWAWMGALGVSGYKGIVSPAYGVYRSFLPNSFNSIFLEELLKSTEFISHYNKVSTGLHSSRLRFYAHMFFDMKIAFPDKYEQTEIAQYIEAESAKIDKAITVQENLIEKLKEYKVTLIDSAVTGKIKVCL